LKKHLLKCTYIKLALGTRSFQTFFIAFLNILNNIHCQEKYLRLKKLCKLFLLLITNKTRRLEFIVKIMKKSGITEVIKENKNRKNSEYFFPIELNAIKYLIPEFIILNINSIFKLRKWIYEICISKKCLIDMSSLAIFYYLQ